jgi:Ni/Co efflux regulator RcnB
MKKLLLTAVAASAVFAVPATAADYNRNDQQVQRSRTTVTKQDRASRPTARPQAARPASRPQVTATTRTVVRQAPRARVNRTAQTVVRPQMTRSTIHTTEVRRPQFQQSRVVSRTTTYRPGTLRTSRFHPIQRPEFRYPRGYSYQRWSIGSLLPSLFLSNNYYFNDYAALGVGAPPYGYHWVRYGPDLLLVQNGTRRIVDVIYGAFY